MQHPQIGHALAKPPVTFREMRIRLISHPLRGTMTTGQVSCYRTGQITNSQQLLLQMRMILVIILSIPFLNRSQTNEIST